MLLGIAILFSIFSVALLVFGFIIIRLGKTNYYVVIEVHEVDGTYKKISYVYGLRKIMVGRNPSLVRKKYGLCLLDPLASWKHLKIVLRNQGIYLIDLQSTNRTYIVSIQENPNIYQQQRKIQPIQPNIPVEFFPETSLILLGNTEIRIEKKIRGTSEERRTTTILEERKATLEK